MTPVTISGLTIHIPDHIMSAKKLAYYLREALVKRSDQGYLFTVTKPDKGYYFLPKLNEPLGKVFYDYLDITDYEYKDFVLHQEKFPENNNV